MGGISYKTVSHIIHRVKGNAADMSLAVELIDKLRGGGGEGNEVMRWRQAAYLLVDLGDGEIRPRIRT
jgi:hypothetical protein